MATLLDAGNFALDANVRLPLTAGITQAAVAIMNEDPITVHHVPRCLLATQVLRNPMSMCDAFAWAVSTNPTVVDKWTAADFNGAIGDFSYVIASVWDAMAGAATA
jgi:hypothetical protein